MNSGELPLYIEPRKFADNDTRIEGFINLDRLSRLADYQGAAETQVSASLRFYHEVASGDRKVEGSIDTQLELQCQRCLEPIHFPVHATVNLIMVWSEEQRDRKSIRLNSSHVAISYAVFCLKKKKKK